MTASDKAFTGLIPQIYDRLLVPMIFAPYAQDLARRINRHAPRDVLETAAGTGALTSALAAELPATTHGHRPERADARAGQSAPFGQAADHMAAGGRARAALRRRKFRRRRLSV